MQLPFTLRHVAHLAGVLALFVIVLATYANAAVASRPVRVLCFDATGKEQMSLGPLHDAKGDLGRDARVQSPEDFKNHLKKLDNDALTSVEA